MKRTVAVSSLLVALLAAKLQAGEIHDTAATSTVPLATSAKETEAPSTKL